MPPWRSDERFGPLPDWLSDVLELVLSDFQQPAVIDLRVGYDTDSGIVWFSEPGEPGRAGFGASQPHPQPAGAEEIVEVAYWLQDQFFHETQGAWVSLARGARDMPTRWLQSRSAAKPGGLARWTTALWCVSAHSAADSRRHPSRPTEPLGRRNRVSDDVHPRSRVRKSQRAALRQGYVDPSAPDAPRVRLRRG